MVNDVQRQILEQRTQRRVTTVIDALYAIAALGGHLKRNGPPGWQTLHRGYQDLIMLELGWRAAVATNANEPSVSTQPHDRGLHDGEM